MIQRKAHRHGHPAQMHSNQRAADVQPGVCLNFLHRHGGCKILPAGGGPAAACMRPRTHGYRFIAVFFGGLGFQNDGAVQMLAALCRQIELFLLYNGGNGAVDGGSSLHTAVFADMPAHDLTGRTPHHQDLAGLQVCLLQQLGHSLRSLPGDHAHFHGLTHTKNLFSLCVQSGWFRFVCEHFTAAPAAKRSPP